MDNVTLPSLTLGQILDRAVAAFPDNEAVVYVDRDFRLTYRQFGDLVDRLACGLMAMGIQEGAFIKLKKGAATQAEDVRDFCRGRISRYKIPKHVAFVDAYPMTASGKIQKYKLVELSKTLFPEEDPKP